MTVLFICGDARNYTNFITDDSLVIIDPPWDAPSLFAVGSSAKNKIVFCDGKRAGDAIAANGPPTWVFVWDCVTSWYTPNRPLKRHKMALWYGDIFSYRQDGAHYGEPCGRPRLVKNSRGEHWFNPDGRGKMLSDLYQQPIISLRGLDGQEYSHSKPLEWITMLLANCRGSCNCVVDLFAGSGVFAKSANKLGLDYIGIEMDEHQYNKLTKMSFDSAAFQKKPEQTSWL